MMTVKKRKRARQSKRKPATYATAAKVRQMVREAARVGAAEAIEHCQNFWNTGDGYRRYINANIEAEADALMAAVRKALREELDRAVEKALAPKSVKRRKRV